MLKVTLTGTHNPLMSHGTNRSQTILLCKVYVRRTDEPRSFRRSLCKSLHSKFLGFSRKTTSQTKLTISSKEILFINLINLIIELFLKAIKSFVIVIIHSKINFINNSESRNLIHRSIQPRTVRFDRKSASCICNNSKIFKTRLPESQKVNIRRLKPLDIPKISKLLLCKTKRTISSKLFFNLLYHFGSKENILIATLKGPSSHITWKLMVNCLSHRELIKVSLKQRVDNRIKFHSLISSYLLFILYNTIKGRLFSSLP